jgi:hypothetical protein
MKKKTAESKVGSNIHRTTEPPNNPWKNGWLMGTLTLKMDFQSIFGF